MYAQSSAFFKDSSVLVPLYDSQLSLLFVERLEALFVLLLLLIFAFWQQMKQRSSSMSSSAASGATKEKEKERERHKKERTNSVVGVK